MNNLVTLVLAAGKGTRMKSDLAKVLHRINDRPMVHYVIDLAREIGSERIILIIGHQKEKVVEMCSSLPVEFAVQELQLGTGHAVKITENILDGFDGDVIVLSGDVPLLTKATMTGLIDTHTDSDAVATLLTAILPDPTGYGRVLRDDSGQVIKIVEQKDGSPAELEINEINVGIYVFRAKRLFETLKIIRNDNVQGEYYLPDVIKIYVDRGEKVVARLADNFDETRGINTVAQLSEAETILLSNSSIKNS